MQIWQYIITYTNRIKKLFASYPFLYVTFPIFYIKICSIHSDFHDERHEVILWFANVCCCKFVTHTVNAIAKPFHIVVDFEEFSNLVVAREICVWRILSVHSMLGRRPCISNTRQSSNILIVFRFLLFYNQDDKRSCPPSLVSQTSDIYSQCGTGRSRQDKRAPLPAFQGIQWLCYLFEDATFNGYILHHVYFATNLFLRAIVVCETPMRARGNKACSADCRMR